MFHAKPSSSTDSPVQSARLLGAIGLQHTTLLLGRKVELVDVIHQHALGIEPRNSRLH